jgi:hypothetical protein
MKKIILFLFVIISFPLASANNLIDHDTYFDPAPTITSKEQANYLDVLYRKLYMYHILSIHGKDREWQKNTTRCLSLTELRSHIDLIKKNPEYFNQSEIPLIEKDISKIKTQIGTSCKIAFAKSESELNKMYIKR